MFESSWTDPKTRTGRQCGAHHGELKKKLSIDQRISN
jgi:hypothetical protein